jgi:hypothetical protein
MRKRAIVLLAAASSFIFVAAGVAREQSDLHQRGENIDTPRMITWSLCRAPSTGSALSVYSSVEKSVQFFQAAARQEDVYSDGCNDQEDESGDGSFVSLTSHPSGRFKSRIHTELIHLTSGNL